MPAPPPPPAPAPHAPLRRRRRGKLGAAEGAAAAAPLRSPAGAGSAGPLPPRGMERRPGARYRRRVRREGGRLPVTAAPGFLSPPASALLVPRPPALQPRAAPDPTPSPPRRAPAGLPRQRDGAVGAPGEERTACPRSAPRLPGGPRPGRGGVPAAPPRSAPRRGRASSPARVGSAPPVQSSLEPARAAPQRPGWGQAARLCSRRRRGGGWVFGRAQQKPRSPVKCIKTPRARRQNRRVFVKGQINLSGVVLALENHPPVN